ncbi:hypothetical protein WJX73_010738, partial [Symbiochloris irregularis]
MTVLLPLKRPASVSQGSRKSARLASNRASQDQILSGADRLAADSHQHRPTHVMQNSKNFSQAVDAKPFVPGGGTTAPQRTLSQQGDAALQATARPFVPGSGSQASSPPQRSMSTAAKPFVPQIVNRQADHPLLPDSDDLLGMTAHAPEAQYAMHGAVSMDRGLFSQGSVHASPFRPQPPALDMPMGNPSAPRSPTQGQSATMQAQSRTNNQARSRGRKQQQPQTFSSVPARPAGPPLQPQLAPPFPAGPPPPGAMATAQAAMQATANADRLRGSLAQRSHQVQAQLPLDAQAEAL